VALKTADTRPAKPEDQELARKLEEQAALEAELADRELRSANLRAELGAFERRYLHFVGSRYAELDEWKAQIAERVAREQPENERAQQAAREARARAEASFKKEERAKDGAKAMMEYVANSKMVREKTERLKALRLAKEAADKQIEVTGKGAGKR